jgi:CHAD domain-containing protein
MNPMAMITLSDEERQYLVELSQSGSELINHRARLILAYADGKPTIRAAADAGISRGRARFWKRQYLLKGMGIFDLDSSPALPTEAMIEPVYLDRDDLELEPKALIPAESELVTSLEIPFPLPRESIGITPDDTMADAGKKVWLFYFAVMLYHEAGTILGENVEELHDMRVSTRRMRSAFDIFSPVFDPKIMKRQLKGLRTIGRVLGQVRDMDVILENALNYQKKLKENQRSGLEPLIADWQATIDDERITMLKHMQSEAYQNFKRSFNHFLQTPNSTNIHQLQNNGRYSHLRDTVPVLVYSRYAAVRAYEGIVPSASVTQLHALRIEFKKFRYTLEYFKEILGEGADQAVNEIKQLQDRLGELHDADVACQLVRVFLKRWDVIQSQKPIAERLSPEPIVTYLAYLYAERFRLTASFPEQWRKFNRPEFRQNIAQAISLL